MTKIVPQEGPINVSTAISVAENSKPSHKNTKPLLGNNYDQNVPAQGGAIKEANSRVDMFARLATETPSYEFSSLKCVCFFSLYYVTLFLWLLVASGMRYVEHRKQIKAGPFWVITLFQCLALLTSIAFLFICRKKHIGFGIWGQMVSMIVFEFSGLVKESKSMRKANTLGLIALISFLQAVVLLLQYMVHKKRRNQLIMRKFMFKRETLSFNIRKQDLSQEQLPISEREEKDEITKEIEMLDEEYKNTQNSQLSSSFKGLNYSVDRSRVQSSLTKVRKSDRELRNSKKSSSSFKKERAMNGSYNSWQYIEDDTANIHTDQMEEQPPSAINGKKMRASFLNQ